MSASSKTGRRSYGSGSLEIRGDKYGREIVELHTGRRVIAFMSENHIDPDVAIEAFLLEPDGDGLAAADADADADADQ
jgi:hypothetical protein